MLFFLLVIMLDDFFDATWYGGLMLAAQKTWHRRSERGALASRVPRYARPAEHAYKNVFATVPTRQTAGGRLVAQRWLERGRRT